jgi:hypothetical protein
VTTSGHVLIPPRRPGDDTLEHRPSTATTAVQSDERIPIAFGRRSDSRVETATSADGASIRASAFSLACRTVPAIFRPTFQASLLELPACMRRPTEYTTHDAA